MYEPISEATYLNKGQLALCRCGDWCSTGLQVAEWNGKEFKYDRQPTDRFGSKVTEFLKLDEFGGISIYID